MTSPGGPTVVQSLREYARGIAGGLMFSLPLLYTMEVWQTGFLAGPLRLLIFCGGTFVLLLGYNYHAGLHDDTCGAEVVIDSVEEMGIGLMVSVAVLFLIGRISAEQNFSEVIGKICVEAMTVAIGTSVGTAQLGLPADAEKSKSKKPNEVHIGGQLVIATCGAALFAANIAPTEEVVVIATSSSILQLLSCMFCSLLLAALILYYIDFSGSERFVHNSGFASIVVGTLASYAVALSVAAAVLWLFGRFDHVGLVTILAETVVLGLVTTMGASAGRLLVQ